MSIANGIPLRNPAVTTIVTHDLLVHENWSIKHSTMISIILMSEDIAANNTPIKKIILKNCPPFIFENILGIVINSKDGPDESSNPYANTAGIITSADNNAAIVSKVTVIKAEYGISES